MLRKIERTCVEQAECIFFDIQMGLYKVKDCIYYQLRVLNRLLDSRRVAD